MNIRFGRFFWGVKFYPQYWTTFNRKRLILIFPSVMDNNVEYKGT
jgi:hypothetical protein